MKALWVILTKYFKEKLWTGGAFTRDNTGQRQGTTDNLWLYRLFGIYAKWPKISWQENHHNDHKSIERSLETDVVWLMTSIIFTTDFSIFLGFKSNQIALDLHVFPRAHNPATFMSKLWTTSWQASNLLISVEFRRALNCSISTCIFRVCFKNIKWPTKKRVCTHLVH